MATSGEIARLAGVSRGTVDRVLNNRGSVSSETREKVMEIVKMLDYRPNRAGTILAARKKKYRIGVILFSEDNPFFNFITEGVEERARELEEDYAITTLTKRVEFDPKAQIKAIDEMEKEGINGLMIAPYNHDSIKRRIDELTDAGIPVVTVNTDIEGSKRLAYIGSDYYRGGAIGAGLFALMTKGDVNICIITGSPDILCHTERIRGLKGEIQTSYPRLCIKDILMNEDDDFKSFDITKRYLEKNPDTDALFFTAAGVYGGCRAVRDLGLNPCIISFDEVPTTIKMLKKGVINATISQQPRLQGRRALNVIFDYLTTGVVSDTVLIDHSILIKENL